MLILAITVALLIFLIIKKINPMLALLAASIVAGLCYGLSVQKLASSINSGIGSTLGSVVVVLALGAMIGKIAEESGAARKLVQVLTTWFGLGRIQWAILCTGLLAGIPLFYNAGFVVLIPLVYAVARTTRLPLLWVGMPMAASLSVTHGFLPPHPGPVALAAIFKADIGKLLLYGLIIAIPVAIIAGILYPRLILRRGLHSQETVVEAVEEKKLPSALSSFLIVLSPILLIAIGTAGDYLWTGALWPVFAFLKEPGFALFLSLALAIILLKEKLATAM